MLDKIFYFFVRDILSQSLVCRTGSKGGVFKCRCMGHFGNYISMGIFLYFLYVAFNVQLVSVGVLHSNIQINLAMFTDGKSVHVLCTAKIQ